MAGVPPAGAAGGVPFAAVVLPPVSYHGRLREAQYDSLQGNYTALYVEQSTVPIGGAAQPPSSATLQTGATQATMHPTSIAYALLVSRVDGPKVV
eukprot:scaffold24907_cov73-Attheya_sp.AAC.1